jgi:hypothetical protein
METGGTFGGRLWQSMSLRREGERVILRRRLLVEARWPDYLVIWYHLVRFYLDTSTGAGASACIYVIHGVATFPSH